MLEKANADEIACTSSQVYLWLRLVLESVSQEVILELFFLCFQTMKIIYSPTFFLLAGQIWVPSKMLIVPWPHIPEKRSLENTWASNILYNCWVCIRWDGRLGNMLHVESVLPKSWKTSKDLIKRICSVEISQTLALFHCINPGKTTKIL